MAVQALHNGYFHTGIYQFLRNSHVDWGEPEPQCSFDLCFPPSQPPLYMVLSVGEVCCGLGLVSSHPIFSTILLLTRGTCLVPCCTLRTQDKRGGPSLRSDWTVVEPECTPQERQMWGLELRVAECTSSQTDSLDGISCPIPSPWSWVSVQRVFSDLLWQQAVRVSV